jgi:hypothetical protein
MKAVKGSLMLVCVLIGCPASLLAQSSNPSTPEIIQIDGSMNPELIPQWSAWGYAFRIFSGGPRQLPTSVLAHVTPGEQTLIMKEADAAEQVEAQCLAKHRRMVEARGAKSDVDLDKEVRTLTLECRWATLHARDRILAGISSEAQTALIAFVESTKAGTSLALPKKDLARFREPE